MGRRLFAAIELPSSLVAAFDDYGRREARRWRGARWTPAANLHVTVGFFGDVDEKDIQPLKEALTSACARNKAFRLKFEGVTAAPPGRRPPTMIWASFFPSGEFDTLSADIRAAATPFSPEMPAAKESRPHVTMARSRDGLTDRPTAQMDADPAPVAAERLTLFESTLSPDGSHYRKIAEFSFGGGSK